MQRKLHKRQKQYAELLRNNLNAAAAQVASRAETLKEIT